MDIKDNGVFDIKGTQDNPLTGKPYQNYYKLDDFEIKDSKGRVIKTVPATYQRYAEVVHSQPLMEKKHSHEILNMLRDNRVLVIESATGTGKTVILPKLAAHFVNYKKLVAVTVPKTSLAKSSSGFCARCMDVKLGDEVGFAHRDSKIIEDSFNDDGDAIKIKKDSYNNKTKILFCTDGWLASSAIKDLSFSKYGVIMMDEIHERNSNMDLLLLYLREALLINPKLRVIVTSATLNMPKFVNYFKEKGLSVASKSVSKETQYSVKVIHENIKINALNITSQCISAYKKYLFDKNIKEDCIIFVNSNNVVNKVCKELKKLSKSIYCVGATSETIEKDKDLENKAKYDPEVYQTLIDLYDKNNYDRRVIVATDVWESSITLPLLKFVIDSGVSYTSGYDANLMAYSLLNKQIAEGQALQRKGRVGRTSNGTCIFLYSKKVFEKLPQSKKPVILTEDFSKYLLDWWNLETINTLEETMLFVNNLLDKPSAETIIFSFKKLFALGYSTGYIDKDCVLSEFSKNLKKDLFIDSNVNFTKAYYYANKYKCIDEVCLIISSLMLKRGLSDLYKKCKYEEDKEECKKRLLRFSNKYGDMYAVYKTINSYIEYSDNNKYSKKFENLWLEKNFIVEKSIEEIEKNISRNFETNNGYIKKFSKDFLEIENETKKEFKSLEDTIAYCMLKGFFTNLAVRKENKYVNLFPNKTSTVDINDIIELSNRESYNFIKNGKKPKYIIYYKFQIFDNSRTFNDIMVIPEYIVKMLTIKEKDLLGLDI